MLTLLVAVDGSDTSLRAVEHVIKRVAEAKDAHRLHLVNVQHPLHGSVSTFVNAEQIKQYHHDEGMQALSRARATLDAAGVAYQHHLFIGEPAEVIARYAKEQGCDEIVIGSRGLSGISSMLMGSVASKVIHLATIPVLVVK